MSMEYCCNTVRGDEKASVTEVMYLPAHGQFPEAWMAETTILNDGILTSSTEFLDTKEEAITHAERIGSDLIVIADKKQGRIFGELYMPEPEGKYKSTFNEQARKMNVSADEGGYVDIYSDLMFTGPHAHRVRLTKEQAIWLMEFLPKAIDSLPEFGWENDVKKDIKRYKEETK